MPAARVAKPVGFKPISKIALVVLLFREAVIQLAPPDDTVMATPGGSLVTDHGSCVGTVPPIVYENVQ